MPPHLQQQVLAKLIAKQRKRFEKIVGLDTSLQNKFMTLRCYQYFSIYSVQSAPACLLRSLCSELESLLLSILSILLGFQLSEVHNHSVFKPLDVGGLGFLPFSELAAGLRSSLQAPVADCLSWLSIAHDLAFTPHTSLRWLWNHIASTRSCSHNPRIGVSVSRYCWLSAWPSFNTRRLSDLEMLFGLRASCNR